MTNSRHDVQIPGERSTAFVRVKSATIAKANLHIGRYPEWFEVLILEAQLAAPRQYPGGNVRAIVRSPGQFFCIVPRRGV
jgi:hypothetical protein